MRKSTRSGGLFTAAIVAIALAGIVPAQSGTTGNGSPQPVQAGVNRCLAMPHDQMMNDATCKGMMSAHPNLFPAGTVTPPNPNRH